MSDLLNDLRTVRGFLKSANYATSADVVKQAIDEITRLHAENLRLREAAEDVYAPWTCGEPLDREMIALAKVVGMRVDPA